MAINEYTKANNSKLTAIARVAITSSIINVKSTHGDVYRKFASLTALLQSVI